MKFKENTKLHLLIIIIVAVSVRIIAAYVMGHKFTPQLWEYEYLTQNMLAGQGYVMDYREYGIYKALLAPGYSFLTYLVYWVFGTSHVLMLFIQFALMAAFGVIIYKLTDLLFENKLIAFISGLLVVLHPGLIYYSSAMLHQLNLYILLFYSSIFLLCLCYKKGELKYFILLGICGGLAVLTRATILPVIFLSLFLLVVCQRIIPLKKRILYSFAAILLLFAVNTPWIIRNYLTFDKVIFAQTNKWEAFWVGNNPEATGGHQRTDGTIVLQHKPAAMQTEIDLSQNDEIKIETIFKKYATQYVKEHPKDFIKGLFYKAFHFWWFYPHTGSAYPRSYLFAYKLFYSVLLGFTFAGLWVCHKKHLWKAEMIFPLVLVLGIWGAHTMNFMEMRHRWTVEPIMLIFTSVAIFYMYLFLAEKLHLRLRRFKIREIDSSVE